MFFRFLNHTLLIIIIGCFSSHSAEEVFDLKSLESIDKLKGIASEIFLRDKNKPYTTIEMHTHSPHVVKEWKEYTKPSSNGINSKERGSMLNRQSIYVFNEADNEKILNDIEKLMKNTENFSVEYRKLNQSLIIDILSANQTVCSLWGALQRVY